MRPILYPVGQTVFYGNGVGVLSDAISCKCTEVLNSIDEIELTIHKDGNHAKDISINSWGDGPLAFWSEGAGSRQVRWCTAREVPDGLPS